MAKESKGIKSALAALQKRFGEPVVMKMSDKGDAPTNSSGRDDLDIALGGGYGEGKIIEIYAESGSGKTGLALEAAKVIQDDGGKVAFIDMEHALNTEYCEQVGVNIDDLYIAQPAYGEMAFETIRALINSGEIDLIIVDSVASMVPKAELEGESGQAFIALQARMMSQGMKLITGPANTVGCTVIFINQLRKTIVMYGPTETTSGGKALKFYATQRLEIKNRGKIKEGDEVIGFKQEINIVKNKIAPPFKKVSYELIYGKGVDRDAGFVDALVFEGIIEKAGAYYRYKGTNIAQGIKKLRLAFEDNPDLVDELRAALEEKRK